MKPKPDRVKVDFIGEASWGVTGSCILIQTSHVKILLECGLYQSCGDPLETYKINAKSFPFKPEEIDFVFAMHNHSDHIGLIPKLYKKGCRAPFIMPEGSSVIARELLEDSANILITDANELSVKYERNYPPAYSRRDVETAFDFYKEYPFGEEIRLNDFVKFRFIPSGHILNSAQIELWITCGNCGNITKKIAYTSDLGNVHIEKWYTKGFEPIEKCNLLIGESTYAGNEKVANRKMRKKDIEKLEACIRQTCVEERARVLIPVFANDRTQNMLTHLYQIFGGDKTFDVPILIDSPMACRCCRDYSEVLTGEDAELWERVLKWENVHFVTESFESREWRESKKPVVVLASSGMMIKGRSVGWAFDMLPNAKDRIVFCGYSAEDSLASVIKNGAEKTVVISGVKRANRCQVTNLMSFTSHMQSDSLLDYYGSISCERIALVHGDMARKIEFSKQLENRLSENNITSKVVCVNKDYSITI